MNVEERKALAIKCWFSFHHQFVYSLMKTSIVNLCYGVYGTDVMNCYIILHIYCAAWNADAVWR